MKMELVNFEAHGDDRGKLVAIENGKEFFFEVQRFYYIYDTSPNARRGFHAHKELKQVLICLSGTCKIHLDDGQETKEILLDTPTKGIYIWGPIWREMYDFSPDAVLGVLASERYTEDDYIRDYNKFLEYVGEGETRL